MKKAVVAAGVLALFTAPAAAADIGAQSIYKAPLVQSGYNWTGFYLFGGGGYRIVDHRPAND